MGCLLVRSWAPVRHCGGCLHAAAAQLTLLTPRLPTRLTCSGTPTFNNTFFCDPRSVTGCYYHDRTRTGAYATAAAACNDLGGGLVRYRSWVEQTMVEVREGGLLAG